MGMLSGNEIERCVRSGEIQITPFVPEQVNPNSVDLRLGPSLLVYDTREGFFDMATRHWSGPGPSTWNLEEDGPLKLDPRYFVLGHTVERIHASHHVAVVDGKSSLGRMSLSVHQTAGFIDASFNGQITLELTTTLPVILQPFVPVCQVRFHTIVGAITPYTGRYQNSVGVIPVRV